MSTLIWFIIVVGLILASPYIARWIGRLAQQWLVRRFQRQMREAMGFPPEEKQSRFTSGRSQTQGASQAQPRRRPAPKQGPLIPKEYAVDVEFTEIHEYSERTEIRPEPDGIHVVTEAQMTDAEYIEIRPGENPEFPSEKKNRFKFWKK